MRYNEKKFNQEVKYYKQKLSPCLKKGNVCLLETELKNEKAFFSLAPLSRAVHEIGADLSVFVFDKESQSLKVLKEVYSVFEELKKGTKNKKTIALQEFIETVNKKTSTKEFEKIFKRPDLWLEATSNGFECYKNCSMEFKNGWFKKTKWPALLETAGKIWLQGYGLDKKDSVSIAFELMPTAKDLELPLQDYLDSYSIAYTMALRAKKIAGKVSMGTSSNRKSQLEPMVRIDDLSATLIGCEYEKNITEPWFSSFKKLSQLLKINRLKSSTASFGVHGKGYGGKHFFGSKIGYATPNKKSRWQGPGQMFLKPWWLTQTKIDNRPAKRRHAITETLPLENYIATCNIDYFAMRKRDEKIRDTIQKCIKLFAKGKPVKGGQTNLVLDLKHIYSKKSPVLTSDIEVNPKKAPGEAAAIFKVKAGRYGNFPGGEVFLTPHKMDGIFVGDVVIAIDQSYIIGDKEPMVVQVKDGKYKILSAPKKILQAFNKRKQESWKVILEYEKSGAMPKSEIESYKRNFNNVGEFAVNTNPKARLSRYLIETEKLAKMMHIALGSGYEPGRETTYHCDIVINNPRQKMDIWGIDKKGKEHWIIRNGKFVV